MCLEIYNANSQTFGSIPKHLSYTERLMKNASVKHLEYYKESIGGLLTRKFLSHIHQLEMNFLHSWVLVLLKFSSNTYLDKSNNMYQQIWQDEGILRGNLSLPVECITAQKRL